MRRFAMAPLPLVAAALAREPPVVAVNVREPRLGRREEPATGQAVGHRLERRVRQRAAHGADRLAAVAVRGAVVPDLPRVAVQNVEVDAEAGLVDVLVEDGIAAEVAAPRVRVAPARAERREAEARHAALQHVVGREVFEEDAHVHVVIPGNEVAGTVEAKRSSVDQQVFGVEALERAARVFERDAEQSARVDLFAILLRVREVGLVVLRGAPSPVPGG
mmetsp:Transcript_22780/g.70454  ORF Transcript_22780/g.70454 Transcript_22780/m.70454 type:complete len:219 (-) Transcript_22780:542-1198(-)